MTAPAGEEKLEAFVMKLAERVTVLEMLQQKLHEENIKLEQELAIYRTGTIELAKLQASYPANGTARLVTAMAVLIITPIDYLVGRDEIAQALEEKTDGQKLGADTIRMWEVPDGTRRAKVKLPVKHAIKSVGWHRREEVTVLRLIESRSSIPELCLSLNEPRGRRVGPKRG
uniref:Uncharacterized protein n=1 Tax=Anopheles farauti TaxID=69004 RepID=A0A182Q9Y9_9DIPT